MSANRSLSTELSPFCMPHTSAAESSSSESAAYSAVTVQAHADTRRSGSCSDEARGQVAGSMLVGSLALKNPVQSSQVRVTAALPEFRFVVRHEGGALCCSDDKEMWSP